MGSLPSNLQKPEPKTYDSGPLEMGVILAVGITLWMASMDELPPEAYGVYLVWSRGTLFGILTCLASRLYSSWNFQREVLAWNEAQRAAKKARKPNEGWTEFNRKLPFSYWVREGYVGWTQRAEHIPATHSAFLSTSLVQPRLFPFPLGLAKPDPSSPLYWESGLEPQIGRFKQSLEFDKRKREAKAKEISTKVKDWDKAQEERKKYYEEQRRVLLGRVWHVKVLSAIVVTSFVSKRLAILALVPFLYSVFTTEIVVLLEGKKSTYKHKKMLRAARVPKENYVQPGMGMAYIYQPTSSGELSLDPDYTSATPILDSAPVLMTSADPRLAGDSYPTKTQPTWFKYDSENLDSGAGGSDGKGKDKEKDKAGAGGEEADSAGKK